MWAAGAGAGHGSGGRRAWVRGHHSIPAWSVAHPEWYLPRPETPLPLQIDGLSPPSRMPLHTHARTHAHTHTCTHPRMHERTHACTRARTHRLQIDCWQRHVTHLSTCTQAWSKALAVRLGSIPHIVQRNICCHTPTACLCSKATPLRAGQDLHTAAVVPNMNPHGPSHVSESKSHRWRTWAATCTLPPQAAMCVWRRPAGTDKPRRLPLISAHVRTAAYCFCWGWRR